MPSSSQLSDNSDNDLHLPGEPELLPGLIKDGIVTWRFADLRGMKEPARCTLH